MGALFERNINKTNDKQRVSRGYDSESGTTLIKVRWLGLENLNGRYVEPGRKIDVAGQSTHRDGF